MRAWIIVAASAIVTPMLSDPIHTARARCAWVMKCARPAGRRLPRRWDFAALAPGPSPARELMSTAAGTGCRETVDGSGTDGSAIRARQDGAGRARRSAKARALKRTVVGAPVWRLAGTNAGPIRWVPGRVLFRRGGAPTRSVTRGLAWIRRPQGGGFARVCPAQAVHGAVPGLEPRRPAPCA